MAYTQKRQNATAHIVSTYGSRPKKGHILVQLGYDPKLDESLILYTLTAQTMEPHENRKTLYNEARCYL